MTENNKQTTFYNQYSQEKTTGFGRRLSIGVSRRIFEFAQIQQGSTVLEIGPGRGAFADICLSNGIDYWALEPNEDMAADLEQRGAHIIRSMVPPIPDLGRDFDVVLMSSVMEHMDSMSKALEVAASIRNILKPGGRFVVYAPDYPNWGCHFFVGDFSHNYVTSWRRLQGLLISAGFREIRGRYQSSVFSGAFGYLISVLASWLPFARLDIMFPHCRLLRKLYKLQTAFLRRVLIIGVK